MSHTGPESLRARPPGPPTPPQSQSPSSCAFCMTAQNSLQMDTEKRWEGERERQRDGRKEGRGWEQIEGERHERCLVFSELHSRKGNGKRETKHVTYRPRVTASTTTRATNAATITITLLLCLLYDCSNFMSRICSSANSRLSASAGSSGIAGFSVHGCTSG